MKNQIRICALVPVYRHGKTIRGVTAQLLEKKLPVILIDDGNDEETKNFIAAVKSEYPEVEVVVRKENGGKGAAVMSGMLRACELGYTHAFQVDADGQHDLGPVEGFIAAISENPEAMICGYPVYDDSVPASRRNGRKITNFWITAETLSGDIKDGMCGFRLYPLEPACRIIRHSWIGRRMTFDIEILVRLHWAGVRMLFRPIRVIYPEGGISNFRMVRDNIAISGMHSKLFLGMIPRIPFILARKVARHGK